MKILFLDHQGVMYTRTHPAPGRLDAFDPPAVAALNALLHAHPDLEIVVSSDWKRWVTLEEMCEFYTGQGKERSDAPLAEGEQHHRPPDGRPSAREGIARPPIGYTPRHAFTSLHVGWAGIARHRAGEIRGWLAATDAPVTHWAAVDDLDMRPYLEGHGVWVSEPTVGLLQPGVVDAISELLK